ncbi:MAG: UvrB/UvrC motif-containing protein, partial [Candidatus Bathyarchaeota archaeon]|nr:UvrB/UvrC motif-containing protein [Candidatus Bathyarchaeota archaeon]
RKIQLSYNDEHGIIPETIRKDVREIIANIDSPDSSTEAKKDQFKAKIKHIPKSELNTLIANLEQEMFEFASKLEFEKAAEIRNRIMELKRARA